MQRFTARFVIVLLLVSVMAPASLALATGPMSGCCVRTMKAHACCIRKAGIHAAAPEQTTIQAAACGTHCHCTVAITGHWADINTSTAVTAAFATTPLSVSIHASAICLQAAANHSGRAPPAISIA